MQVPPALVCRLYHSTAFASYRNSLALWIYETLAQYCRFHCNCSTQHCSCCHCTACTALSLSLELWKGVRPPLSHFTFALIPGQSPVDSATFPPVRLWCVLEPAAFWPGPVHYAVRGDISRHFLNFKCHRVVSDIFKTISLLFSSNIEH